MKRTILLTAVKIVAVCLIVVGIFVLMYPTMTDMVYQRKVYRQKEIFYSTYSENETEQSKTDQLYEELVYQNKRLYQTEQSSLSDPFSYEQAEYDLGDYGLEDNVIGFVSIPKIDVELPLILGASEENLALGAAHLTNTSYPVGGENTNCVIAAHRGFSKTAMFRNLDELSVGDEIYITNFRETLTYRVSETLLILPCDVDELKIIRGKDMVTLFTCAPYRSNTHRLLVRCERVYNDDLPIAESCADIQRQSEIKLWIGSEYVHVPIWCFVIAAVLIIVIASCVIIRRVVKKH